MSISGNEQDPTHFIMEMHYDNPKMMKGVKPALIKYQLINADEIANLKRNNI